MRDNSVREEIYSKLAICNFLLMVNSNHSRITYVRNIKPVSQTTYTVGGDVKPC